MTYFRVVAQPRDQLAFEIVLEDERVALVSVPFAGRDALVRAIEGVIQSLRDGIAASLHGEGERYRFTVRGEDGALIGEGAECSSPSEVDALLSHLQRWAATDEKIRVSFPLRKTGTARRVEVVQVASRYELEQPSLSKEPGLELLRRGRDGLYCAQFNDAEGRPLIFLRGFTARYPRDEQAESALLAAAESRRYVRGESEGRAFFHLIARNGREIARSRWFASVEEREQAIRWLMERAPLEGRRVAEGRRRRKIAGVGYGETQRARSGAVGFERFRDDDGHHYFNLNDERGGVLLFSHGYGSAKARDHGIRSLLQVAGEREGFHVVASDLRFTIRAGNGRELARSRSFADRAELERAIAWVSREVVGFGRSAGISLRESVVLALPRAAEEPRRSGDATELAGAGASGPAEEAGGAVLFAEAEASSSQAPEEARAPEELAPAGEGGAQEQVDELVASAGEEVAEASAGEGQVPESGDMSRERAVAEEAAGGESASAWLPEADAPRDETKRRVESLSLTDAFREVSDASSAGERDTGAEDVSMDGVQARETRGRSGPIRLADAFRDVRVEPEVPESADSPEGSDASAHGEAAAAAAAGRGGAEVEPGELAERGAEVGAGATAEEAERRQVVESTTGASVAIAAGAGAEDVGGEASQHLAQESSGAVASAEDGVGLRAGAEVVGAEDTGPGEGATSQVQPAAPVSSGGEAETGASGAVEHSVHVQPVAPGVSTTADAEARASQVQPEVAAELGAAELVGAELPAVAPEARETGASAEVVEAELVPEAHASDGEPVAPALGTETELIWLHDAVSVDSEVHLSLVEPVRSGEASHDAVTARAEDDAASVRPSEVVARQSSEAEQEVAEVHAAEVEAEAREHGESAGSGQSAETAEVEAAARENGESAGLGQSAEVEAGGVETAAEVSAAARENGESAGAGQSAETAVVEARGVESAAVAEVSAAGGENGASAGLGQSAETAEVEAGGVESAAVVEVSAAAGENGESAGTGQSADTAEVEAGGVESAAEVSAAAGENGESAGTGQSAETAAVEVLASPEKVVEVLASPEKAVEVLASPEKAVEARPSQEKAVEAAGKPAGPGSGQEKPVGSVVAEARPAAGKPAAPGSTPRVAPVPAIGVGALAAKPATGAAAVATDRKAPIQPPPGVVSPAKSDVPSSAPSLKASQEEPTLLPGSTTPGVAAAVTQAIAARPIVAPNQSARGAVAGPAVAPAARPVPFPGPPPQIRGAAKPGSALARTEPLVPSAGMSGTSSGGSSAAAASVAGTALVGTAAAASVAGTALVGTAAAASASAVGTASTERSASPVVDVPAGTSSVAMPAVLPVPPPVVDVPTPIAAWASGPKQAAARSPSAVIYPTTGSAGTSVQPHPGPTSRTSEPVTGAGGPLQPRPGRISGPLTVAGGVQPRPGPTSRTSGPVTGAGRLDPPLASGGAPSLSSPTPSAVLMPGAGMLAPLPPVAPRDASRRASALMPVPEPEWPSLIPAASVEAQRVAVSAVRQEPAPKAALAPVLVDESRALRRPSRALPVALVVGVAAIVAVLAWLLS